jgi:hypothetical protein
MPSDTGRIRVSPSRASRRCSSPRARTQAFRCSRPTRRILASSFALVWSLSAVAGTAIAEVPAASSPNHEVAFAEAVRIFKSGDTARALPLFLHLGESIESPNVQLYVGYCQLELGHDREAHQAFSLAVKQSIELGEARYAAAREAAQGELAKLNPRLATLTISLVQVPKEFVVKLDHERLDPALVGSPIVISPGLHQVEAESAGAKPISREVLLDKGGSKVIAILFEEESKKTIEPASINQMVPAPAQPTGHYLTVLGYVAGGLGLVGLATYAVAGLKARNAYNQLQADCPTRCSDAAHRNRANEGKTLQTVANVGLGVGVAGTLAGAALLYVGFSHRDGPRPSLAFAPGGMTLSLEASF